MNEALAEMGERSFWMPPEDATPEQLAEYEAYTAKMLVPDEAITTRVDVGPYVDAKWAAIHEHVTQISDQSPFMLFGLDGWRRWWSVETFILRESRIPSDDARDGPVRRSRLTRRRRGPRQIALAQNLQFVASAAFASRMGPTRAGAASRRRTAGPSRPGRCRPGP